MKRRKALSILGAIVASSLLSVGCNKSNADQPEQNYGYGPITRCPSSGSYANGSNTARSPRDMQDQGVYGSPSNKVKKHNPLNVERIRGEILDKKTVVNPDGSTLVMLRLSDGTNEYKVLLGPSTYLDRAGVSMQIGDTIDVKGSKMSVNGDEMFIATDITKSGYTIRLRNEAGQPVWGNGRQMPPSSGMNGMRH